MLKKYLLLPLVEILLQFQKFTFHFVHLCKSLMKTRIGLPLVFEESVEVDLEQLYLVFDVVSPLNHHVIELNKNLVQVLDVLVLGLSLETSSSFIKLGEFISQVVKLIHLVDPLSLEPLACPRYFLVKDLTLLDKTFELSVVCAVSIAEGDMDKASLSLN